MTHATLTKFGYPGTLIREYEHWCLMLRPKQATFGALVLIAKSEASTFPEIPREAFTELADITREAEQNLRRLFSYDKINYVMLMMVDPHAHFHVLPRYQNAPSFDGMQFPDPSWPGPPDLTHAAAMPEDTFSRLLEHIKKSWTA